MVEMEEEPQADIAALSDELDRMATELEAQREVERMAAPPAPTPELEPVAVPEPVAPPTEEELADRAHAEEVREVMKALTQLPRGLPTTLWDKDMAELAKEIVDGPKRTAPDGTLLVQLEGAWYTADHRRIGTFLRESKEDGETETSISSEERKRKLKQLEERLLEGKISEETYISLKKKYESD